MKELDIYFKKLQRDGIYHFAHLMPHLDPIASEIVNLLNETPIIEHREYDRDQPGDKIDYYAFFENWEEIKAEEYKQAFNRATHRDFKIYINSKLQP